MSQKIEFERTEDGEFHLFLDGEDKGPVDRESLRKEAGNLHMHFRMFGDKELAEAMESESGHKPIQELTDEELEEEIEEVEQALKELEDTEYI